MMRSLFAGVSGLNNHQTRMDVVGNNIANVNTTGYKKGRVNFQDMLSQSISGAARPTEEKGGVNPKQVGLGMMVGSIDTIHTQGALQTTGVKTDIAVMGDGFLIQQMGEKRLYTRNGALGLDRDGMLVNPANGYKVQGFKSIANPDGTVTIDTTGGLEAVRIPIGAKDPAKATGTVKYKSNLNATTPAVPANASEAQRLEGTWRTTINVYDSRGQQQEVRLNFTKFLDANGQPVQNRWRVRAEVQDVDGRQVANLQSRVNAGNANANNEFIVTFNQNGAPVAVEDGQVAAGAVAQPLQGAGVKLSSTLSYEVAGSGPQRITLDLGTAGLFDGITQFAAGSSTKAYYQDGQGMGYMQDFQVDDTGTITGVFTNGTSKPLARLAMATFTNVGGLTKEGETYFAESNNSGRAMINAPGQQTAGLLRAGTLEMSNVDLANEFTDMIVTQRGFQANSRTITTADTLLEELMRLKR